jgi:hypothetical protein
MPDSVTVGSLSELRDASSITAVVAGSLESEYERDVEGLGTGLKDKLQLKLSCYKIRSLASCTHSRITTSDSGKLRSSSGPLNLALVT